MATATTGPRLSGRRAGWIVYKKRQSNNTTRDRGQRASRAVDMGEDSSGRIGWGGGGGGTRGGRKAGARARDDSGSVRRYCTSPYRRASLPDLTTSSSRDSEPDPYSRTRADWQWVKKHLYVLEAGRLAGGLPAGTAGYKARRWTGQNSKRQIIVHCCVSVVESGNWDGTPRSDFLTASDSSCM